MIRKFKNMLHKGFSGLVLLFLLSNSSVFSQEIRPLSDTSFYDLEELGSQPKKPNEELYDFKVGGFYRFFATYTQFQNPYLLYPDENDPTAGYSIPRDLFIGDDSQLPNLQLNLSGRPSTRASWGLDLYLFQLLNGNIGSAYGEQVPDSLRPPLLNPLSGTRLGGNLNLLLGINLYTSYATNFGNFDLKVGGIHWTSLSELTLASTQAYSRYMLFERNPWDPMDPLCRDRYNNYYGYGSINQDQRWGEQAFSGVILDGTDLPKNLSFRFMYGKTALDGGFYTIPNMSWGGRIRKNFGTSSFIGINSFNNISYIDSLNLTPIGFHVVTSEIKTTLANKVILHAEIGTGKYNNEAKNLPWGEAINVKLITTKSLTKLPITFHYYRVSPYVVNNNAIYSNSYVPFAVKNQTTGGMIDANTLRPFASAMVNMGEMVNNRQAIELNAEKAFGKLVVAGGLNFAGELLPDTNSISFGHAVNNLTRSRFWRWNFPNNIGPYQRQNVIYRGTYELANVYESSDTTNRKRAFNKKFFNNIELQLRYKTKFLGKTLFAFYLARMATAQNFAAAVIPYSNKAYIRSLTNELELYYELNERLLLNFYFGLERIAGNEYTDKDKLSGKPRDQTGKGFGIGTDISISKNMGLFLRHRWAFFADANFNQDAFNVQETLVELKIGF